MRLALFGLLVCAALPVATRAQAPVFEIAQDASTAQFSVKASVAIDGKFDKWDATLTFPSTDVTWTSRFWPLPSFRAVRDLSFSSAER
jgi:hypothetical protein